MQTVRSASCAASPSRSASEAPTTHSRPSRRQARTIRTAISPRLAMKTLESAGTPLLRHAKQRLPVLDESGVLGADLDDRPGDPGGDRVHHLHDLDQADNRV